MTLHALMADASGPVRAGLTPEETVQAIQRGEDLVWIDFDGPTDDDRSFLLDLGLHPLAVDDTISPELHQPKVTDFGSNLFIISQGVNYAAESELVETTELNIFVGPNFVISSHNEPLVSVASVLGDVASGTRRMPQSSDLLALALLTALANNINPTLDRMADAADKLDDEAIRRPDQDTLQGLLKLKRSASRLHRLLVPQRDMVEGLTQSGSPLISAEAALYFQNLSERTLRLEDRTRNLQERADNGVAIYLSSLANRQNETMKMLSLVAAIFLPLTLVAGIYGMNFENMPELGWSWGYFGALGLMATLGIGIAGVIWLRAWLSWGRRGARWVRPFTVELPRQVYQGPLSMILPHREREE